MTIKLSDIPELQDELLKYIEREANIIPVRPEAFGITATEFAIKSGIGYAKAKSNLDDLVTKKKLKSQMMRYRHHKILVYHK